jgi:hypothetical protein
MSVKKSINLQAFYSDCLKITEVDEQDESITITLKSVKRSHFCLECGEEMRTHHSTYQRTVQDLPILHKNVMLKILAYEYNCDNLDCEVITFVEDYDGFVGRYERMTNRCADFVRALAFETNCEGAAMICRLMGIKICGQTIIGMLRKLADCTVQPVGDVIGVDDFAYRMFELSCSIAMVCALPTTSRSGDKTSAKAFQASGRKHRFPQGYLAPAGIAKAALRGNRLAC